MARIRTIKPDFFQSEDVAVLSYRARLTWIGLWTHVDDEGRCKANPRLIKGALWPLEDDVSSKDVSTDIDELERNGKLVIYESQGEEFIQILNWLKHQRISRPSQSKFPAPSPSSIEASLNLHGGSGEAKDEEPRNQAEVSPSRNPHGTLHEGTMPEGEVEVEVEKEVEGETRKQTPHKIPKEFQLTTERETWAKENTPAVNIRLQTENFIDYWKNGDGSTKKKSNWESTWRNWMRKKQEDAESRGWKPAPKNVDPKMPQGWY